MFEIIFKFLGAVGLISITYGVLTKDRLKQNYLFTFGGLTLLTYSSYLKDPIFIPLQIIFTIASIYEIIRLKKNGKFKI